VCGYLTNARVPACVGVRGRMIIENGTQSVTHGHVSDAYPDIPDTNNLPT